MEFVVTGALFLAIALLVRSRFKGVNIVLPEKTEEDFLDIPKPNDYEEETRAHVDNLIEQLDEKGITEEMREEIMKTSHLISERKVYWNNEKNVLEEMIEERKKFITTETMYPRNYALTLSDLEVARDKVQEYKEKNPLKKDYTIEELIVREKHLVAEFLKTKKKIEEGMELMSEFEKNLSGKKEEVDYFSQKQKMYLDLMNGDTKKAKESFRKIMKKIEK